MINVTTPRRKKSMDSIMPIKIDFGAIVVIVSNTPKNILNE